MKTFTTSIVLYRREVAWACLGALLWFVVLSYRSANYLHSRSLTLFFLGLMILLVPFVLVAMWYLRRAVTLQLQTESIVLEIRKSPSQEVGQTLRIALADIASYQIEFPNDRFACLVLKLTSGEKHRFSFRRGKRVGYQREADAMLEEVHKYFVGHRIAFTPSFYASPYGLYTIIGLLVLLSVPFIIAANLGKNVPLTIIGSIMLVGQVVMKRVSELNFYRRWKGV